MSMESGNGNAFRRMTYQRPGWTGPGLAAAAVLGTGMWIHRNGGTHSIGDMMAWGLIGGACFAGAMASVKGRAGSPTLAGVLFAGAAGCAANATAGYAGHPSWGVAVAVLGAIIGYGVQGMKWDRLSDVREARDHELKLKAGQWAHEERMADKKYGARVTVAAFGLEAVRISTENANQITAGLRARGLLGAPVELTTGSDFDTYADRALDHARQAQGPTRGSGIDFDVIEQWANEQ